MVKHNHIFRCLIWRAESSKPQLDRWAPEQDLEDARALIERRGWIEAAALFIPGHSRSYLSLRQALDDFETGLHPELKAYRALVDLLERKDGPPFDLVIVRDRTRLGRGKLGEVVEELLRWYSVQVYSMSMPQEPVAPDELADKGDTVGVILEALEHALGRAQVIKLRAAHRAGIRRRQEQGYATGSAPWGWKLQWDEALKLNVRAQIPERIALLRRIRQMYVDGAAWAECARYLNALPDKVARATRGGLWDGTKLRQIVLHPFNRGYVIRGRYKKVLRGGKAHWVQQPREKWELLPGQHEPAFTEAEWRELVAAEAIRHERLGPRARGSKRRYSGLLRCGYCGGKMYVFGSERDKAKMRYACYNHRLGQCDHSNYTREKVINEALAEAFTIFREADSGPAAFDEMVVERRSANHSAGALRELESITKALAALPSKMERWNLAFERGVIDINWFADQKARVDGERETLEARLAELQRKADLEADRESAYAWATAMASDFAGFLASSPPEKVRAALLNIIEQIEIRDNRVSRIVFKL